MPDIVMYVEDKELPDMVFAQPFDCYFFLNDCIVRCSTDDESFAPQLITFIQQTRSGKVVVKCLSQPGYCSFLLNEYSSPDDYLEGVAYENIPVTLPLSTQCYFGFGIYDTEAKFAIYSFGFNEIAVLGVQAQFKDIAISVFGSNLLSDEELYRDLKLAYHPAHYDLFEKDYARLKQNYKNEI